MNTKIWTLNLELVTLSTELLRQKCEDCESTSCLLSLSAVQTWPSVDCCLGWSPLSTDQSRRLTTSRNTRLDNTTPRNPLQQQQEILYNNTRRDPIQQHNSKRLTTSKQYPRDPQQQNNTQRFTTTTQYPKILHNNKRSSTTTEHPDIPLYPLQDILPLEFYNKNNALFCQLEDPVSSVESDRNIFCKLYWVN